MISSTNAIKKFLDKLPRRRNKASDVAMFHTGRCGSSVLGLMLNQHSRIQWAREIFEKHAQDMNSGALSLTSVEKIIETNRNKRNLELFGFETKYLPQQHLSDKCINMELADYITLLRQMQFDKFIILHRKNYLRRIISAQVGIKTGSWHSQDKVESPTKVRLNVHSLGVTSEPIIKSFESMDEALAILQSILKRQNTLFLTYEDDILEDPREAYLKVCRFLKIPDEEPEINFVRTNPFRCEDIITNYDEVEKILRNSRYSWMLED
jgi:hypothetical protein